MSGLLLEEEIEHLDPGDELHCDQQTPDGQCARRAEWWIVCRACEQRMALCTPHMVDGLAIATGPRSLAACSGCRRAVRGQYWSVLFRLEPIGGIW